MGLDQFWYKTKIKHTTEVDFEINEETDDSEEIYYHRKIPALHDYMTDLYLEKGGIKSIETNLSFVFENSAEVKAVITFKDGKSFDNNLDLIKVNNTWYFKK